MSTGRRVGARQRSWVLGLGLYLLGIFIGAIDTGIVTPARTIIADDLGVNQQLGIWMITVYTLAYAAAIPVMGKLADRIGRKPVYLTAIVLFGVGSLLCGLAQDAGSFWMLIAARVIQAIGGGGILPIATAEIGTEVPPERRGMALGLVGAVFGIANLLGASAGSLILGVAGPHNWQWIFYVNVPITALIVIAGVLVLPNHREASVAPLDLRGIALLVAMIMSLLYGLTNIDFFDLAGSLRSVEVYPYLAAFVVLLPLFVLAERHAADPVLNLSYFTHRPVALTLALSFLSGFVLMGVVFVPQLAENALELPSGSGGYLVILLGLASGVGAPLSGRLTDAWGAKRVLALGGGISAVAAVSAVAWLIPHPGYPSVIGTLLLIGLGLGFVIGSPLNYLMLQLTEPRQANSALGTVSLIRSIGTTVAPAIMVGFLAHAGAGMQDRLIAQLPSTVKAPELPYAATLQREFARWKTDDRFADALKGVEFPDLAAKSTIDLDLNGGGQLPADLVELVQTADVTTIVPVTATVARRMFAQQTPAVIADITSGVETGIAQLGTVRHTLTTTHAEMTRKLRSMERALTTMRATLARMDRSVRSMNAAEASMTTGIAGMSRAITGMDKGIAGITKARAKQAKAIAGMNKGLAGLSRAIAGVRKGIAGIDRAVAGIDAALAQQRAALAALQGSDDPAAQAQIARLTRAIEELEKQRAQLMAGRGTATAKLATLRRQHSTLTRQRDALHAARATLAAQRARLVRQRDVLTGKRAALTVARARLTAGRDKLLAARLSLARSRDKLADGYRALDKARDGIVDARAEVDRTVRELRTLDAAVPGAFDQALTDYLAQIDRLGPELRRTFQSTLNEGFRDLYLLYGAACLLLLGLLPLIPVPPEPERGDQPQAEIP